MNKLHASLALAASLGMAVLPGCASLGHDDSTLAQPALSKQALAALAQAESDVRAARAAFTLWTPAEDALNKALAAAQAGDSAGVIEQAKLASGLCRLSADQAAYPSTELK